MRFTTKCALWLIPALALAMPALAQTRDVRLSDSEEPGSYIIFPKFVNAPAVSVDGALLPRTEIEIGVVNPPGTGFVYPEHTTVKVRFHWVCPGDQTVTSKFVCKEVDFDVFLSINGKLAFSADGNPINANSPRVPAPPCKNGYLVAWVIDNSDRPIKFDGLIGDAVIRGPALTAGPSTGSSTAVESYRATTIQAWTAGITLAPIVAETDPATGTPSFVFDGGTGHYQALSGKLYGDVRFDRETAGGGPAPVNALNRTFLIFLTLDVRSNRPNNPTFVPLVFYNESLSTVSTSNPLWEARTSSSWEFLCWSQVQLSTIDVNLTQVFQNSRKGIVIAGPAEGDSFIGINDPPFTAGDARRTLLGMVQTTEGTAANAYGERGYIFQMYNDSVVVPTRFVPFPFN